MDKRKIIFSLMGLIFGIAMAAMILAYNIASNFGFFLILFGILGAFLGYILAIKINRLSKEGFNSYYKIILGIIIIIFVIGIVIQVFLLITSNERVNWQTYQNEEYGLEIKYPDGYYLVDKSNIINCSKSKSIAVGIRETCKELIEMDILSDEKFSVLFLEEVITVSDNQEGHFSYFVYKEKCNYMGELRNMLQFNKDEHGIEFLEKKINIGVGKSVGVEFVSEIAGKQYDTFFQNKEQCFHISFSLRDDQDETRYINIYESILDSVLFYNK